MSNNQKEVNRSIVLVYTITCRLWPSQYQRGQETKNKNRESEPYGDLKKVSRGSERMKK